MSQHLTKKQFAQYMENGKAKFYRLAFCYVKNEHDALEIISEATYRGFIHLNKLEKPEFFDTWMSRIIINCAYDLLKKQKKYEFVEVVIMGQATFYYKNSNAPNPNKPNHIGATILINYDGKVLLESRKDSERCAFIGGGLF